MSVRGKGKCYQWLVDRVGHEGDECLTWPFFTNPNGYGQLGHLGIQHWAHRAMCELVNGPPPSPKHEASHSCGRGDQGCIHPKHLTWKTKVQNRADCALHGTNNRNPDGNNKGKLTPDEVAEIRSLRGQERQVDIAARFGISWQSVSMIQRGKMYAATNKINHWTKDEDLKLRLALKDGCNFRQAAQRVGRPLQATTMRAYRIGLKSGWARPGAVQSS